jgi:hypothetical protein
LAILLVVAGAIAAACSSNGAGPGDAGDAGAADAGDEGSDGGDDTTTGGGPDDSPAGGPGLERGYIAADGCFLLGAPCGTSNACCSALCEGGTCTFPPRQP